MNNFNFFRAILLFLALGGSMFSQKNVSSFQTAVIVTDDVSPAKQLVFGLDPFATDSIDLPLGESELPPMPPSGNFEARFILPLNNFSGSLSSWIDFRGAAANPYSGTKTYRLHFQKSASASSIKIKWNFAATVSGTLKDIITGSIINVPMNAAGEYQVTNPASFNKLDMVIQYDNISTGIAEEMNRISDFKLFQNYPNPFNPSTTIAFNIPTAGLVHVDVYSITMEHIAQLQAGLIPAGNHEIEWNAAQQISGMYFAVIRYNDQSRVVKMLLVK